MTPTSRLPGRFHGPTYCTLRGQTDQRAIEGMLLLTQQYPVAEWALPLSGATLQSERQRQELVQAIGWLCAPLSDQGNALRANVCLQLDLQATQMLLDGQMDLCGIVGKPGAQVQRVQICPPLGLTDAQERRMATILRARHHLHCSRISAVTLGPHVRLRKPGHVLQPSSRRRSAAYVGYAGVFRQSLA